MLKTKPSRSPRPKIVSQWNASHSSNNYSEDHYLFGHRVRVDLTHVISSILPLHTPNVQRPRIHIIVGDTEPGVVGNDVLVDGEDGLGVGLDPGDLGKETFYYKSQQTCT